MAFRRSRGLGADCEGALCAQQQTPAKATAKAVTATNEWFFLDNFMKENVSTPSLRDSFRAPTSKQLDGFFYRRPGQSVSGSHLALGGQVYA
jgi:hypothetical protein